MLLHFAALFGATVVLSTWPCRDGGQERALAGGVDRVYAYGDWKLLSLILLCAADGYLVGRMLPSRQDRARPLLFVGIVIPLVILGTFKYFNFFVDEVGRITEAAGLELDLALSLVLPVGISFYIFRRLVT